MAAGRRRLAAPQAMTFTARGWGPRVARREFVVLQVGFMRNFRVIQGALPHKAYFDFLHKAKFGRRCKKKLRRIT
jgi:hypothetical protein